MKKIALPILIFFCILDHACVEPFDLKNISDSNALVVEGTISNLERPQQVKLSRTSKLNESVLLPEEDATVTVKSGKGEIIQFPEIQPGTYESANFAGVVGERYTLLITTANGRKYTSAEVVLKDVPPIGKVSAEFLTSPQRGIKISIDTEDPQNKTHYYRWDYVETYEIQTPFPSNYVVLPGAKEATWRSDRVDQCWASDTLKNILIKSTRGQDQDKVTAFPLRFIPETSYIFRVKYSILIQQFALSEQAYRYWDKMRIFNETQGTLSDVQPGTINGNIIGVTNPSETVLGYFDAGAISEQRVFFDYKDFVDAGYKRPGYRTSCYELKPIFIIETQIADYMQIHGDDLAIWDVIGVSPTALFELLPKGCCDCSNMGTTKQPPYWE